MAAAAFIILFYFFSILYKSRQLIVGGIIGRAAFIVVSETPLFLIARCQGAKGIRLMPLFGLCRPLEDSFEATCNMQWAERLTLTMLTFAWSGLAWLRQGETR